MRLINTDTLMLREFTGSNVPPYAILSHTWDHDEVTFQEMNQLSLAELRQKKGRSFDKIETTCRLAQQHSPGLQWAWVDTCCIDKTSSAELTEAINSMFAWYSMSAVCYVYLFDLGSNPIGDAAQDTWLKHLAKCRWFLRGWTLQELIASPAIDFFNSDWVHQGTKMSLKKELAEITKIDETVLNNSSFLSEVSVAQRMSWAAHRKTTRIEDMAYCLLGIFNVQMPLLYGEAEKSFIRLQEEIIRETNDLSLFAWKVDWAEGLAQPYWGILASCPKYFADCSDIELWGDPMHNNECVWTSKGLRMTPVPDGGLSFGQRPTYLLSLQCHRRGKKYHLSIYLEQLGCDLYVRVKANTLRGDGDLSIRRSRIMYIRKTVSPLESSLLPISITHAVDFTAVINTLMTLESGCHYLDDEIINNEGYWDHQRSLWLMQGGRNGRCSLPFKPPLGSGTWKLWVNCDVYDSKPMAYFTILSEQGKPYRIDVFSPEDNLLVVRYPYVTDIKNALTVSVAGGIRDGQPVYVISINQVGAVETPRKKWTWRGTRTDG